MSVNQLDTFVLLFPNEEWSSKATVAHLNSDVAQLQPSISFAQSLTNNISTISSKNAAGDGTTNGFLYVPDLDKDDTCFNTSKVYVPANVTRQANLSPTDFTLIAIAPWISAECSRSYLMAARMDPARGFIFYHPDNGTTLPPGSSSPDWDLHDNGAWQKKYQYPVYAIPGAVGATLMHQLSLYSGNMTNVPYGHQISELPGYDPRDYVRLYTEIRVTNPSSLPSIWAFLVVVFAVLVAVLGLTSALMHLIQRNRRISLRERVARGEVDLEALGIKRLTVPLEYIERLPIFTYNAEGDEDLSPPTSPYTKQHTTTIVEAMGDGAVTSPRSDTHTYDTISGSHAPLSPQLVVLVGGDSSDPDSMLVHKFLPYSQPTCPICLEDFESGVSEIRELPCGHIFHPDCIDIFLENNSSLCPICKKSTLPIGYCPINITNAMAARERNLCRIRSRVTDNGDLEAADTRSRIKRFGSDVKRDIFGSCSSSESATTMPLQPRPVVIVTAVPPRPQNSRHMSALSEEISRQQLVQRRIRELAASQAPIRDPDTVTELQRPHWRKTLSKAFPGF